MHASKTREPLPLVPRPRRVERCSNGALTIDASTRIMADDAPEARAAALWLARSIGTSAIGSLPRGAPDPESGIVLRRGDPRALGVTTRARDPAVEPPKAVDEESYALDVDGKRAVVRAKWPAGMFYGAQTLAQLAGMRRIGANDANAAGKGASATSSPTRRPVPCVRIEDGPAYPFRAMHLDVARHFFEKPVVERFLDLLAYYRLNVFHLHLTDDQGFRIEIDGHPELTQVGGKDGFYTRQDAKALVDFAKERFLTVVPEIEMPGHARAILAAHPEISCTGKKQPVPETTSVIFEDVLCAGNEQTYALVDAILADVVKTFPSHLVHVGGDEVPRTRWKACPKCRAKMAEAKIGVDALQGVFMTRVAATLARLGRRPLAWDEALDAGLPKDGIVLAWQSPERAAAAVRAGHDVVVMPHQWAYLNVRQSKTRAEPAFEGFVPWTKVLTLDPGKDPHALGGEGALWSEHVKTQDDIDTMVMPRLAALAEALWSGTGGSQEDFIERFKAERLVLDASGIKYFIEPPVGLAEKTVFLEGEEAAISIAPPALFPDGSVHATTDGSDATTSSVPFATMTTRRSVDVAAVLVLRNGRTSPTIRGRFEAQRPRPAFSGATFVGAKYTYYEGTFHRLPKLSELKPKKAGALASIALDPSFRKEGYAVRYESFITVPSDGVVRFVARADDGVRVLVDREVVVEDDGEHEARDVLGEIALAKGTHAIEVQYFQGGGEAELSVTFAREGDAPMSPVLR